MEISVQRVAICVATQLFLIFGLAGLFWPEKFATVFEFLMFPWTSSHRLVRMNSLGSLGVAVALALGLLLRTI
jgi:hypothetical protein